MLTMDDDRVKIQNEFNEMVSRGRKKPGAQTQPEVVHSSWRIIGSQRGLALQRGCPVGSGRQCAGVANVTGAKGDTAGKRSQRSLDSTSGAVDPARREHRPLARLQPEASVWFKKDTSKLERVPGRCPEGEGSTKRRNDGETASAGPGGEMAEGGPHHRLQKKTDGY